MSSVLSPLIYILFILSIHYLSEPQKAYKGNLMAMIAMSGVILLYLTKIQDNYLIPVILTLIAGAFIGIITAYRIKLQDLPQMVALLNGLGGLSAGIIGLTESQGPNHNMLLVLLIISIGFITFGGSLAAFIKLAKNNLNIGNIPYKTISLFSFVILIALGFCAHNEAEQYIWEFSGCALFLGLMFILPIGAADMSIIITILNAFSGWSTVLVGFSLQNSLMIIVGTLIGASGTILSYIMTQTMNRSLIKILFSSQPLKTGNDTGKSQDIHQATAKDAAFLMANANKIIIVPGFGMAAANAQNDLATMTNILITKYKVEIKFAIHPVAGRMPGHMNILLAEANIDSDNIFELKDINQEFSSTDVVYIIGANDITNPYAKTKKESPIYKMPILEVEQAKNIIFVKRSLAPGFAQTDNPLFYSDKTLMLLGDAKKITKQIITLLEEDL